MKDIFIELAEWFAHQCNGEWEHSFGITMETCDNPGWLVKIDLRGTMLEGKNFVRHRDGDFSYNVPAKPWIDCSVEENRFRGAGDITRLHDIIRVFIEWAKEAE